MACCSALLCAINSNALDISNLNNKKPLDYQQQPEGSNYSPYNFQSLVSPSGPVRAVDNTENSVDPQRYYIGGGDEFFISVIDIPSIKFTGSVNEHCDLFVPELGLKKLGKISLAIAQKEIGEFVQAKLRKTNEIYVSLSKIKTATVSINGAISNAGTYTFRGTSRVLDALKAANEDKLPSLNDRNFRKVSCTNKDTTKIIDLFTYLLKNDISGNPYLYPGDNITIEFATQRVFINAQSKAVVSGWVPIKELEKLSDFLSLFTFDKSMDTTTVLLETTLASGNRTLQSISWNDANSVFLHDRDIITLTQKKNYNPVDLIVINGEVSRPGMYPIIKDSTTFNDLLAMAGGITQFGALDRAVIARRSKIYDVINLNTQSTTSATSQLSAISPIRPEMYAGFSKMNSTQDYSIIQIKKYGPSVKLRPNDEIIIPRKDVFIYVSGNVKRPGACKFEAGISWSYYVHQCGGFTSKADRGNIFGVRYYGSISQMTDLSEISEGDIIVVPDSQEAKFLSTILLPVISTVATIVSLLLAAYTIYHK